MLTLREAAVMTGISYSTIHMDAAQGKLQIERYGPNGGGRAVTRQELADYVERRTKTNWVRRRAILKEGHRQGKESGRRKEIAQTREDARRKSAAERNGATAHGGPGAGPLPA
jgi:excisionase family DNA binding protein